MLSFCKEVRFLRQSGSAEIAAISNAAHYITCIGNEKRLYLEDGGMMTQ
jgi:hypothetical protein